MSCPAIALPAGAAHPGFFISSQKKGTDKYFFAEIIEFTLSTPFKRQPKYIFWAVG